MADGAERRISALPMLSVNDKRKLLEEWNDTRVERQDGLTVHALFEAQAAKTPDSIAAVFGPAQLTYAELDGRANQLANHLRKLGVKPGVNGNGIARPTPPWIRCSDSRSRQIFRARASGCSINRSLEFRDNPPTDRPLHEQFRKI